MHFPLCREIHFPSKDLDYSVFNRISRRYANLKSGVPQQELRIPITASHRRTFIWTFSENLLVLQSSYFPIVLTLIYLDARTGSRRIINGELALDADEGAVTRVMVCRNMLAVERVCGKVWGSPRWVCSADCFRVSLSPDNSKVIATEVSSFATFGSEYADFSHETISDHSGKYYAAYSLAPHSEEVLKIWDMETGEMIKQIPVLEFPRARNVSHVLVIAKQGPDGPQQVLVAGNDWKRSHRSRRTQAAVEWDGVENFKVFPIDAESPEWTGYIAHNEPQDGLWPFNLRAPQASSFKVLHRPSGINSLDTPDAPGYLGEDIGLALWHWDPGARNAYSSYHKIVPAHPPTSTPNAPLAIRPELRMASRETLCSPFNLGFHSELSLFMDVTPRPKYSMGKQVMLYKFRVRGFRPSATSGITEIDWETRLMSSQDRTKSREILFVGKDVMGFSIYPLMVTDEGELATAFLDMSSGEMELVLLLWDDGFHGELPLGGRVFNLSRVRMLDC